MRKTVLFVHGKRGNAQEAEHYKPLWEGYDVFGMDYKTDTPWETKQEILAEYERLSAEYDSITIIAQSIGAYFTMNALSGKKIERAFFIAPIVTMEKLIDDMMKWAGVTAEELRERQEIQTSFGETLSWKYYSYVKEHPIQWDVRTDILYGELDDLISYETVSAFAERVGASLTVMKGSEHWFHSEEQMAFLDSWMTGLQ